MKNVLLFKILKVDLIFYLIYFTGLIGAVAYIRLSLHEQCEQSGLGPEFVKLFSQ